MSASISEHLLWHHRLTHLSTFNFNNISLFLPQGTLDYEICHFSKLSSFPFKSLVSHTTQIFEIVHSDVWGHFSSSLDGFKYFVTFIDDFSKVT